MSMAHHYDFFDRDFFDDVWPLSWRAFQRRYRTRWATSRNYEHDGYSGESLRGLICFALNPEPSETAVEEILANRTIQWTIRNSSSQFWLMAEIISQVPGYRSRYQSVEVPTLDVSVLIATAIQAYRDGRIGNASLRATMKLHSPVNPGEWLWLTEKDQRAIKTLSKHRNMYRPIYQWQGQDACGGPDDFSNCLSIPDTQRFLSFIFSAWEENLPVPKLKVSLDDCGVITGTSGIYFRDYEVAHQLRRAATKVQKYLTPCVYRVWL